MLILLLLLSKSIKCEKCVKNFIKNNSLTLSPHKNQGEGTVKGRSPAGDVEARTGTENGIGEENRDRQSRATVRKK